MLLSLQLRLLGKVTSGMDLYDTWQKRRWKRLKPEDLLLRLDNYGKPEEVSTAVWNSDSDRYGKAGPLGEHPTFTVGAIPSR